MDDIGGQRVLWAGEQPSSPEVLGPTCPLKSSVVPQGFNWFIKGHWFLFIPSFIFTEFTGFIPAALFHGGRCSYGFIPTDVFYGSRLRATGFTPAALFHWHLMPFTLFSDRLPTFCNCRCSGTTNGYRVKRTKAGGELDPTDEGRLARTRRVSGSY